MSYMVKTNGMITLKGDYHLDRLITMLFPHNHRNRILIDCIHKDEYTLSFNGVRIYDDSVICPLLLSIEPFTVDGEIEYMDKDGNIWHHYYDPKKKKWFEQVGHIEYNEGSVHISEALGKSAKPISSQNRGPWELTFDWEATLFDN